MLSRSLGQNKPQRGPTSLRLTAEADPRTTPPGGPLHYVTSFRVPFTWREVTVERIDSTVEKGEWGYKHCSPTVVALDLGSYRVWIENLNPRKRKPSHDLTSRSERGP